MQKEKSCGAVVYRIKGDKAEFLIVESIHNHFSFPKGHMEEGETEIETALREIKEETSLKVELDEKFRQVISYYPEPGIYKEVIFFIAQACKDTVKKQDSEIKSASWLSYEEAKAILTFPRDKEILSQAVMYLHEKGC